MCVCIKRGRWKKERKQIDLDLEIHKVSKKERKRGISFLFYPLERRDEDHQHAYTSFVRFFYLNYFCYKETRGMLFEKKVKDQVIKCHVLMQILITEEKSSKRYWLMPDTLVALSLNCKGRKVRKIF